MAQKRMAYNDTETGNHDGRRTMTQKTGGLMDGTKSTKNGWPDGWHNSTKNRQLDKWHNGTKKGQHDRWHNGTKKGQLDRQDTPNTRCPLYASG